MGQKPVNRTSLGLSAEVTPSSSSACRLKKQKDPKEMASTAWAPVHEGLGGSVSFTHCGGGGGRMEQGGQGVRLGSDGMEISREQRRKGAGVRLGSDGQRW